jgi:hypothetical protein
MDLKSTAIPEKTALGQADDEYPSLNVGRSTKFADTVDLGKDLAEEARRVMDILLPEMEAHREYVDYWEVTNEMDLLDVDGYRRHAEIHFHFIDIAEREGFKIALFTWYAGTPEWEEMEEVVPLLMTEFGMGPYASTGFQPAEWVAQMAWYDDRMREDDYVLSSCPFTLGPGTRPQWQIYDWEEALPDYAQYIISLKDG